MARPRLIDKCCGSLGWARLRPSLWKVAAGKFAARSLRGWRTVLIFPELPLLLTLLLPLLLLLPVLLLLPIPTPLLLPIPQSHRELRPKLCSGPDQRRLVHARWDEPWFSRRRMCCRIRSSDCARRKRHREAAAARRLE